MGLGRSEDLLGQVRGDQRNQIQISTKAEFVFGDFGSRLDGHPDRVVDRWDELIQRLGTDYIDFYFLHRPDPDVPIEESRRRLDGAGPFVGLGDAFAASDISIL